MREMNEASREKFYITPYSLVQSRRVGFGNGFLTMIHERTEKTGANRVRVSDPMTRRASSFSKDAANGSTDRLAKIPRMPPLLPVLLPLVLVAIITGVVFAWLFPPVAPGKTPPLVRFTDVTAESGIKDRPAFTASEAPTTLGGAVACFDYDADGDVDLLFVKGASWPWEASMAKRLARASLELYRNDGTGRFTEVTAMAGLNVELQGMGVSTGDFDNDGLPDVYITCVGSNHLFHNRGGGRFEDVTESAGVGGAENTWSTGAAWIDFDNDGRLDLVVSHYAGWAQEMPLEMAFTVANVGRSYGTPTGFIGVFPTVYRNLGDGRFAIVKNGAGLRATDPQTGFPMAKTLAVVPVDVNEDGHLELLFTYHTGEATLFLNQADGTFRPWTIGADHRREGISAGLGAASSLPFGQLSATNERFGALQAIMTREGAARAGVVRLETKLGAALMDYDLDGRIDVFTGNAQAEADVNRFEHGREFSSTPALLWNRGNGWIEVLTAAGTTLATVPSARGTAAADFDGDGDLDIAMAQHDGPPRLLRNDQREGLPWLQIDLVATRTSREAGGARVEVHTPTRLLTQTAGPALSFMAQSTSTLTFGLGDDARVRKVVVHWPSGARLSLRPEGVNRKLVIVEQ